MTISYVKILQGNDKLKKKSYYEYETQTQKKTILEHFLQTCFCALPLGPGSPLSKLSEEVRLATSRKNKADS